jgi:hypothetical protein
VHREHHQIPDQPIEATDLVVRLARELPAPAFRIEVVDPTHLSIHRA